ncbi:hypothetical protein Tco_0834371, partial [Tanacetum coccineum]
TTNSSTNEDSDGEEVRSSCGTKEDINSNVDREGKYVILGDFNEVRSKHEIFGTLFNVQGANAFNDFISMESLMDLLLEGYAFTWAHKSANKMNIEKLLNQGGSNEEILNTSSILLKELNDINAIDYMENGPKAKIRRAIEGDENSKYFHGILKQKQSQISIGGVLVDSDWLRLDNSNMDSIEKCIAKRTLHDQKTKIRLNKRKLQMNYCKAIVVQALDANLKVSNSLGNEHIIKENENNVSGNENSISKNKSSKSGTSSSISRNNTKADGADIRPTYDTNSLEQLDNDEYNVFAIDKEHPKQSEFVNDTYMVEQGDTNTTLDSSDMSNNRREADQDDDLAKDVICLLI